jgi:hypothetical protein
VAQCHPAAMEAVRHLREAVQFVKGILTNKCQFFATGIWPSQIQDLVNVPGPFSQGTATPRGLCRYNYYANFTFITA